jgi:hypothetical protein
MHDLTSFEALRMIEVLRSGIPSRLVARAFTGGRKQILSDTRDALTRVAESGTGESLSFQAEYGNGKSHLLNQLFDLAWSRNFVVSKVVLNKETPMNQLHILYQKAAENCSLPGRELPGFENALFRIKPDSESIHALLEYCEQHLHPRLKLILEICLRGNEENQHIFYGDLLGNFARVQLLKSAYRLTCGSAAHCPTFKRNDPSAIMSYFKFLTRLFTAMGYAGWVILFDEAELIERHGPISRITAYCNLHELMNLGGGSLQVPLFSAFAFASTFETFLGEKDELGNLPFRAQNRSGDETAGMVKKTIEHLQNARLLPDLTGDEYEDIAREVVALHGKAFQWEPDLDIKELLTIGTVERRVRTMVRGIIQSLDLAWLGRPHEIRVEALKEEILPENESFFSTSPGEASENGGSPEPGTAGH